MWNNSRQRDPMVARGRARRSFATERVVAALLALIVMVGVVRGQQPAIDPVEDLRLALRMDDVRIANDNILDFRRKNLEQKVAALKTLGELRRALAMDDWKEEPNQGRNEQIRLIDEQMRRAVGKKFQEVVRFVTDKGPANARLAVANMIAEIGPSIKALDLKDPRGFANSLTPEVVKLAQDPDLAVRQEGLRALGTINPDADKAVAVFRETLKSGEKEPRILAAQGLAQMMRVVHQLKKRGQNTTRVTATEPEVVQVIKLVVPAAQLGLRDSEARVRAGSLDAVRAASLGLVDMIYEPLSRKNFPPEGRKLSQDEVKDILENYKGIQGELVEREPILKIFGDASADLVPPLSDPVGAVRMAGVNALEGIAWARYKLKRRIDSVPLPSSANLKPLVFDDPLAPFLASKGLEATARLFKDPETRVRRLSLDFVENLGDSGVPLIPALGDTLSDTDRFVRWAAARALGELPAEKAYVAVPALSKLLLDDDLNVRQAAATSLESMGSRASPAAQQLAHALLDGDVEFRIMVLGVLIRLPLEQARVAAPQVAELLVHPDPRLRKAAAESLGRFGPHAVAAIPALRRLLGDDNAEVRQAASDAMLAILVQVK